MITKSFYNKNFLLRHSLPCSEIRPKIYDDAKGSSIFVAVAAQENGEIKCNLGCRDNPGLLWQNEEEFG